MPSKQMVKKLMLYACASIMICAGINDYAHAQSSNVVKLGTTRYHCDGKPTFKNNIPTQSYCLDRTTGAVYVYTRFSSSSGRWDEVTDTNIIADIKGTAGGSGNGTDGKDAVVTIGTISTVTGAPNTSASVTIQDGNPSPNESVLNFTFTIPKGKDGIDGTDGICPSCPPSGGASGGYTQWTPDLTEYDGMIVVHGTNSQSTISQKGIAASAYANPSWAIVSSDDYDWANLQFAMYREMQTGKPVHLISDFRIPTNKYWDLGKFNFALVVEGNMAVISTYGSAMFNSYVVGRPLPANNTEANQMIQARYDIRNVSVIAQAQQIGFRLMPMYHSKLSGLYVKGASVGIKLEFALNTQVEGSRTYLCDSGFVFTYGKDWGGNTANSQSNHSGTNHCHVGGGQPNSISTPSSVGFIAIGSSGIYWNNCIVEQAGARKSYAWDFMSSTVVKIGSASNNHVEGVFGNRGCASGDAFFWIRMAGNVTINRSYMQYAGCFINAGANAGYLNLIISETPWIVYDGQGKGFVNNGHVAFDFQNNSAWNESHVPTFNDKFYVGAVSGETNAVSTPLATRAGGTDYWTMSMGNWYVGKYEYKFGSVARLKASRKGWVEDKRVKLILRIKPEELSALEQLPVDDKVDLAAQARGNHEWYFDTMKEAVDFANMNPAFTAQFIKQ